MPDQAGGDLLPPWSGWQGTWILLQSFPVPKRGTSASTLTLPHSVTNTHCPGVHMPSNNRAWTQGGSYHTQKCLLRSIQPNISHLHFTPKTMTFFIKKILKREAPPPLHTHHTHSGQQDMVLRQPKWWLPVSLGMCVLEYGFRQGCWSGRELPVAKF